MSRYVVSTSQFDAVAYGFDRVPNPGYFYQVFDASGEMVEDGDTRQLMSEGEPMKANEIADRLVELGVSNDHVEKIRMDLPV